MTTTDVRYHALDALRAVAMLLGLWLHAAIPYAGIDELPWAVRDGEGSVALLGSIGAIHAFRMQVFFAMAGFFAHLLVERRGRRRFALNRLTRVVLPFFVAWMILTPILFVLWGVGWQFTPPPNLAELQAGAGFCLPTWHLWFLQYLALMYVGVLLLVPVGRWLGVDRLLPVARWLVLSRLRAVWLAVPALGLLWLIPGWNAGPVEGCFTPEWGSLAYYSLFFGYGWVLYACRDDLGRLVRGWIVHAVVGFVVLLPAVAVVMGAIEDDPGLESNVGFQLLAHGAHALLTCALLFAFVGLFLAHLSRPSPTMRYVSDASYWLYIVHLPLQIAMSIVLVFVPVSGWIKLAIVLLVTTALMVVTYHWCVRYTFIGRILNGPRVRPGSPDHTPDSVQPGRRCP